jgi:Flp pilus assembly protein protease CpaA
VNFALLLLAAPICIADMCSFVIPNIYTKTLFYVGLIHITIFGIGHLQDLLASIAVLVSLVLFRIGMGDIKLLGLILITHSYNAIEFIGGILLVAVVHIVVLTGIHRKIPSKIPLAPSIFAGLITYLATS